MDVTAPPLAAKADTESISASGTTCFRRISVRVAVSASSPSSVESSILSKATLVGAKTVKVASSSLNVVTKSAAVNAATSVEKSSFPTAMSTIVCVESVFVGGTEITWSIT